MNDYIPLSYKRYLAFLVILLLAGAGLLYYLYAGLQREMINQLNARQTIHARQAAKGIEAFFKDHIDMLRPFAANSQVIDLSPEGRRKLGDLYAVHARNVHIISRIDAQGLIRHAEPYEESIIGKPIASMSLASFHEARLSGQASVSDLFTNLRGQRTVIAHVPVFKDGNFRGTLAVMFIIDQVAAEYLDDIRIGRDGYAWLIDRNGIEIYCPVPGHVGRSVLDNCRDFPDILAMAERMMRGEQGMATYRFDKIRGDAVATTTKQAVFMPVRLANNFWSIAVATPETEITAALEGFRNRLLWIALVMAAVLGLILYLLFRSSLLQKEIGRREEAEQLLTLKSEELERYFTQSLDLLCIADTDGFFRRLNPQWETTLGYPISELESARFLDFIHPDDVDRTLNAIGQLRDDGEILNFVNRCRRRDGCYRWIEWRSRFTGDLIYAVARDITERKEMEEALRAGGARLRSIFVAAPVGIGIVSNRILLQVNDSICRMTGYTAEELQGRSARMLYPTDEEFESVGKEKYAQISQWGIGTVETHWMRKDGTVIDVLLSSAPIDPSDWAAGVTFTALDITQRKGMERALKDSEERYRGLFENAIEGIYQSTPEGRFTHVNPAMARMCGYASPQEMIDSITDIATQYYADPADRELFRDRLEANDHIDQLEYAIRSKDGTIIWVSGSARILRNDRGQVLYYEGRTQDITARKQAEEKRKKLEAQLLQAQKLESIGTLAGGIAHDFNNLLMGIQGYASLMLMSLDSNHPHYEKLKAIESQVASGADLTRQLLGFAQGGRYEAKPTDINALAARVAAMFGRTKKEIRIHEKFDDALRTADVDRGQIEQVLLNLFVNAWQAMPGGGDLFLQTEHVHLDAAYTAPYGIPPGDYVKVSVTDTGIGMDEKTRQRIFDPFFTTKEMGRGTGLGLASAYGIVKRHGGLIHVYSEKGHGTTFNIYLPASGQDAVREAPAASDIQRGHETILLVDDERMILDVTKEMLEYLGYRVLTAQSGVEALETYRTEYGIIDVVILDMIMPDMGGGKVLDRMKVLHPGVRVILASGYSINGEAMAIMERGVRLFLQKPFRINDLSQKIREALNG